MNEITLIIENERYKSMVDEYEKMCKELIEQVGERDKLIEEIRTESRERAQKIIELYDHLIHVQKELQSFKTICPN